MRAALTASAVIACVVAFGCSASKDNSGSIPLKPDGGAAGSETGFDDAELADAGASFDVSEDVNLGDAAFNPDATCATAEMAASRPPVDVIVVVDTSGSMSEEMTRVQNNINKMSDYLKAS